MQARPCSCATCDWADPACSATRAPARRRVGGTGRGGSTRLGSVLVLVLWLGSLARADPPESPLDSAERVASHGGAAFDRGSLVERLRAIRAAPFGAAPETALEPLAQLAAGRDPACAPAAAVAVRRITARLDRGTLDANEADLASLERAERVLRALVADRSARADIRRLANVAAAELGAARSLP